MKSELVLSGYGRAVGSLQRWEKSVLRINRLHIPVKGGALYRDTLGQIKLCEEHLYLLPNSLARNFELLPKTNYDHLYIDFQAFPPILGSTPIEISFDTDDFIFNLCASFALVISKYEPDSSAQRKQVSALLELILRHLRVKYGVVTVKNERIEEAIVYIENNFALPIGNDDIAAALDIDKRHLIRLFNQYMNMTPYQYLTQCRIEHSLSELTRGKRVAEVAESCGYQSENAFRIAFKKTMGCTPGEFIRQNFYYERIKA